MQRVVLKSGLDAYNSDAIFNWRTWINKGSQGELTTNDLYMEAKAKVEDLFSVELVRGEETIVSSSILKRQSLRTEVVRGSLFVSKILVDVAFQGRGLLYELFAEIDSLFSTSGQLSIIVARRGVDGMYPKFGYSPFGTFTRYRINERVADDIENKAIQFKKKMTFGGDSQHIYANTYRSVFPFLKRQEPEWNILERKLITGEVRATDIYRENTLLGYVIFDDKYINETAFDFQVLTTADMRFILNRLSHMKLDLRVQEAHPVIQRFEEMFSCEEFRRPADGGHLFKSWDARRSSLSYCDEKSAQPLISKSKTIECLLNKGTFIGPYDEY